MTAGERIRGQLLRRTPTTLLLAGGAMLGVWRGLQWLAVHLTVAAVVALALLTWWAADRIGWPWLAFATGCICIGLGAVMELRPRWWQKITRTYASRRRLRWYRDRWEPAMVGAGLTMGDDLPQLVGHRFGGAAGERDLDVLTVRTVPGQVLTDWRHVQHRLAAAWGRTRVRVHPVRGRDAEELVLELFCSSRPLPAATMRRAAVAGGQVPTMGARAYQREQIDAPSTTVDESVDQPFSDPNAGDPTDMGLPPRGAFPRTPRADQ